MAYDGKNEKIEALIQHTVEECERNGLSISEAVDFVCGLELKIGRNVRQLKKVCKFKDMR